MTHDTTKRVRAKRQSEGPKKEDEESKKRAKRGGREWKEKRGRGAPTAKKEDVRRKVMRDGKRSREGDRRGHQAVADKVDMIGEDMIGGGVNDRKVLVQFRSS